MDSSSPSNKYFSREYAILGFIIVATFIANVSNYGFNIIAARWLGRDDYGALASLLSIFLIFSFPTSALQAVMAKHIAIFKAEGQEPKISTLFKGSVKIQAAIGVIIFLIFACLSEVLSNFLKIGSAFPIIVLGSAIAVGYVYPIFVGSLQGYQYFGHMGINMIFQAFGRVFVGIILIQLGWGIGGAMGASTLALMAAIVLAYFQGRPIFNLRRPAAQVNFRQVYAEFVPAIILFAIFWSYTGVDMVIAKRVLTSLSAGEYASAVFMGKIILFLPMAVSMVMFPKVAGLWARGLKTANTFLRYLLVGVLLSGFAGLLYVAIPRFLVSLLYGSEYLNAAQIMGIFGIAMTLYTAVNMMLFYFVAIKATRIPIIIMLAALILEILAMSFIARTPERFALIHLVLATLLVLALLLIVMKIKFSEEERVTLFSSRKRSHQIERLSSQDWSREQT